MEQLYKNIRSVGGRMTKIKKMILIVLSENHCLINKNDLIKKLQIKKIQPNRSTIYRELRFLEEKNIIIKTNILDEVYYELPHHHHHHLICQNCKSIQIIPIKNFLQPIENKISKKTNFNIKSHSLEFYGHCKKCQ